MSSSTPTDGLPLTTLNSVIFTTGPFLFTWTLLRTYVGKNSPIPGFSSIITANSIFYSAVSALLSYLFIQSYLIAETTLPGQEVLVPLPLGLSIPFLDKSALTIPELGYIYHLTKIYEYIDVFLLVGQGKVVGQHMAFHHITMPYFTYFRVLNCGGGADWRVFALANTVHHVLMYAYFGGLGNWLRRLIPVTGWIQLALGISVDAIWLFRTEGGKRMAGIGALKDEPRNRGLAVLTLARYAMLYFEELKGGKTGASKVEGDKVQSQEGGQVAEESKKEN